MSNCFLEAGGRSVEQSERPTTWHVEADADDATAAAVLATDRRWNGYSLADLAPPLRAFTTVAVARQLDAHAPAAACLFYRHPSFNSLIPHGAADGVAAILAQANAAGAQAEHTRSTWISTQTPHGQKTARNACELRANEATA